jgi:hypothetical protein
VFGVLRDPTPLCCRLRLWLLVLVLLVLLLRLMMLVVLVLVVPLLLCLLLLMFMTSSVPHSCSQLSSARPCHRAVEQVQHLMLW